MSGGGGGVEAPRGWAKVTFDSVTAMALENEVAAKLREDPNAALWASLRMTLFDFATGEFRGRTWRGKKQPVDDPLGQPAVTVELDAETVYVSGDSTKQLIGVLELVLQVIADDNAVLTVCSGGWSPMGIFDSDSKHAGASANYRSSTVRLHRGSPRVLLGLNHAAVKDPLHPLGGRASFTTSVVHYTLAAVPEMAEFGHLIPDCCVIGGEDAVPGLWNPDAGNNTLASESESITLVPTVKLFLDCIRLTVEGGVTSLDETLLTQWTKFQNSFAVTANLPISNAPDVGDRYVSDRRLRVGVHNGLRYTQQPTVVHLAADPAAPDTLTFAGSPALNEVPIDPACIVIIELQFTVIWSTCPASGTDDMVQRKSQVVTVRWLTVKPFGDPTNLVPKIQTITDQMLPGPVTTPDRSCVFGDSTQHVTISLQLSSNSPDGKSDSIALNETISGIRLDPILPVGEVSQKQISPLRSLAAEMQQRSPTKSVLSSTKIGTKREGTARRSSYAPQLLDSSRISTGAGRSFTQSRYSAVAPSDWTQLSRASEAALRRIAFTRHVTDDLCTDGRPPPSTGRLNINREIRDLRRTYECGILAQGISLSPPLSTNQATSFVNKVYMTYRFFRSPPEVTPCLDLTAVSEISHDDDPLRLLVGQNDVPGCMRIFKIDPTLDAVDVAHPFLQYLEQRSLQIDVWDGESHILIASGHLPCRHFLRGGHTAVETQVEIPLYKLNMSWQQHNASTSASLLKSSVFSTSVGSSHGLDMHRVGSLFCELSSIGHVTLATQIDQQAGQSMIIHPDSTTEKTSYLHRTSVKLVQRMADISRSAVAVTANESSVETERKISRVQRVREAQKQKRLGGSTMRSTFALNQTSHENSMNQSLSADSSTDLQQLEKSRTEHKHNKIAHILRSNISTTRTIRPAFGTPVYFEYILTNPMSEIAHVRIVFNCDELRVLTDADEQHFYKMSKNVPGAVEKNMVSKVDGGYNIMVHSRERVHIPFLFSARHSVLDDTGHTSVGGPQHDIRVDFVVDGSGQVLSVLNLQIEPQPFEVSARYRFWQSSSAMFKQTIPVQLPARGSTESGSAIVAAIASDSRVITAVKINKTTKEKSIALRLPHKIGIDTNFFVALYSDLYKSTPCEIFEITVCCADVIEVSITQGEIFRTSLNLRGDHATRVVKLFSSSPDELYPELDSVLLHAGAIYGAPVAISTPATGQKQVYVNAIDMERNEVVQTFLVVVTSIAAEPSKVWDVEISAEKCVSKKIVQSNPYADEHSFSFSTDRPDVLGFKVPQIVIPGRGTKHLHLKIVPMPPKSLTSAKIFMTNNDGYLENVYELTLRVD